MDQPSTETRSPKRCCYPGPSERPKTRFSSIREKLQCQNAGFFKCYANLWSSNKLYIHDRRKVEYRHAPCRPERGNTNSTLNMMVLIYNPPLAYRLNIKGCWVSITGVTQV